ncbi:MAG: hypothetical protein JWM93_624 [Frankiales bacterium]|nr:hypothetical protein [Frankiales bacterium]
MTETPDDASAAAPPDAAPDDVAGAAEQREVERRRLIDLTRRDKGLPERRDLGTDRRTEPPAEPDG